MGIRSELLSTPGTKIGNKRSPQFLRSCSPFLESHGVGHWPFRINSPQQESERADCLVGSLFSGLGAWNTTIFVDQLRKFPGSSPIHKLIFVRATNHHYGLTVRNRKTYKTGGCNIALIWVVSCYQMFLEFKNNIATRAFNSHQCWVQDTADDKVARHYKDKLMVDSPKLMMLSISLFGDLIKKVA